MSNVTKIRPKKSFKNILVQYKGGGYDGCFWEWNYFLFDAKGTFHDLASSGWRGIKDRAAALKLLTIGERRHLSTDEPYIYSLTNKKHIDVFQAESAPQHVAGVVGKVNEIYGRPVLYWVCQDCEHKQYDGEMFHDGYKGNGGIGVQLLGMLCSDCYCGGLCGYCGDYDNDPKTCCLDSRGNEFYACRWCAESLTKSDERST